jgi:hypothetical protein
MILRCNEATYHFPLRKEPDSTVIPAKAGIQERWRCVFWMPNHADCKKLSLYSQLQVRHDTIVD